MMEIELSTMVLLVVKMYKVDDTIDGKVGMIGKFRILLTKQIIFQIMFGLT